MKKPNILLEEVIYNQVIQEYSALIDNGETWTTPTGDNIQDIIGNIVDLVIKYGEGVYNIIRLDDYSLEQLMDYEYLENKVKHHELITLVEKLFQSMDDNTTSLWRDDLECTMECVVIEDCDEGVKMDECDEPTMTCNGSVIVHLMDKIKKEFIDKYYQERLTKIK